MKTNNLILVNCDTDSIMVCKPDQTPFTQQEEDLLLEQLNSIFPERISWEDDGTYSKVITFKSKNYILWDGKKLKTKGSALRDQKKEKALKEFQEKVIWAIINETSNFSEIYDKYINEALNIKDIMRWSTKKTVTEKIYSSPRTNETKVKDALEGSDYVEGDKIYMFFKSDETLCLAEKFDGDYNVDKLLEKLYKSTEIFSSVIDTEKYFLNYKLKRNKKILSEKFSCWFVSKESESSVEQRSLSNNL